MKTVTTFALDPNYRIESDANSWNLVYEELGEINPKTGRPKLSTETSYHPDLKTALSKYLDEYSKGSREVLDVFTRLSVAEQNIQIALENLTGKRLGA